MDNSDTLRRVKGFLDAIIALDRVDNDTAEVRHEAIVGEFRGLPREGLVDVLIRAAGRNKRRKRALVFLLSELTDDPKAVVQIENELEGGDSESQHWLIQIVAHRKLVKLAPLLNRFFLPDTDARCNDIALWAAGRLKLDVNFDAIFPLVQRSAIPLPGRLLQVLTDFGRSEGGPFLEASFHHPKIPKSDKVYAAWGLGKLQDPEAIEYLKKMLYDPDFVNSGGYVPGESMRAAQAYCDIKGLHFEWNKSFVEARRDEWIR